MSKEAYGYTIASKGERFIATLVEGIIFGILFIVFYLIFGGSIRGLMEDSFDAMEVVYSAVSGIIVGAIFYPMFSGNLGHRIFNLKVISRFNLLMYLNCCDKKRVEDALKFAVFDIGQCRHIWKCFRFMCC
jgi:hypothetical protein